MDDQEDRKENCTMALDGLDDGAILEALKFQNENERLAKIRDAINAKFLRELNQLKSFTNSVRHEQ